MGELRTMEVSLGIRDWALSVAPCLLPYAEKYSHVEPNRSRGCPDRFLGIFRPLPLVLSADHLCDLWRGDPDPVTGFC